MTRLATIRTGRGHRAVRIDDDAAYETGHEDVGALLAEPAWRGITSVRPTGTRHELPDLDYAPLVPKPDKIVCVGANYRDHIAEMGHDFPKFPTLFPKYALSLTGAFDPIPLPPESDRVDWEVELTVVIGERVRRASPEQAARAIAGYTVANDVSMRDYQRNTPQFLAGKIWEACSPVGPWMVVAEPGDPPPALPIRSTIDGEVMQSSNTDQLVFDARFLVEYVSTMITLVPGDLILTGTPGGVGDARSPKQYLQPGQVLVSSIDGIGELRNEIVREVAV